MCKGLVGDKEKMVDMEDYRGNYLVIVFYPKDFTKLSESTLDFLAELATLWTRFKKQELGVIGKQHWFGRVPQSWDWLHGGRGIRHLGEGGQDVWGAGHHQPMSIVPCLVDRDGVVQAVKVSGRGGLGVGGLEQLDEAWKLIKDSFTM